MFQKFDEEAQKVLKIAKKEMQELKHEYVGTEHLMLGILELAVPLLSTLKSPNLTSQTASVAFIFNATPIATVAHTIPNTDKHKAQNTITFISLNFLNISSHLLFFSLSCSQLLRY